ncbi:MAG TPA: efflux RND transporter periplasmic adaptor subunit [Moraxellaceae bacterium]|nr:efflux RND transporter periplasmic adaptor subunit [Moraxellaceae bacterium]
MMHRTPARAALLALTLAGLSGCGGKDTGPAPSTAPAALELAPVDVARVTRTEVSGGLPVSGTLQPLHQTTVQSRVAAEVGAVLVREGERVTSGQVLARLGTQDLEARVRQAEAQLAAAEVDAKLARALAERNKELYDKKYFPEIEYARSVGDADARDENVRAQKALVAIARKALNDAEVRAPQAGIIARRYIEPGSSVGMDAKLFEIVDLSEMELEVPVPATDIAAVKVGQRLDFTVTGFGERRFQGNVARINPVADPGTRAISVYARVPNPGLELKGGMFARGEISAGPGGAALRVPLDALHEPAGQDPWVLVLADGRLQKRTVTIAVRDERRNELYLKSGVNEGDTVIVAHLTDAAIDRPARLGQ